MVSMQIQVSRIFYMQTKTRDMGWGLLEILQLLHGELSGGSRALPAKSRMYTSAQWV